MRTKLGGKRDGSAEEEERVESVENDRDHWMAHEAIIECHQNEVDEGQHRKHRHEDAVVDDRWVARDGASDDVTDERQDEEGPDELSCLSVGCDVSRRRWQYLQATQAEINYARDHFEAWVELAAVSVR